MLRDLTNEMPIHHVADKYETPHMYLQIYTTEAFCKKMGWSGLAVLLKHYAYRLDMGDYNRSIHVKTFLLAN